MSFFQILLHLNICNEEVIKAAVSKKVSILFELSYSLLHEYTCHYFTMFHFCFYLFLQISLKKLHLLIDLTSNENAHDCSSGQKHIDERDFLQYLSYIK